MTGEGGTRVVGANSRDGKQGKMDAAITKLHEAKTLFPIAETMAEGLVGAVDKSTAYTDEKLAPLRTDVKGVNERMRQMTERADAIDTKATSIERSAGEASSAAQHAEHVSEIARGEAEKAATSAMEAKAALESISQRDNEVPKLAVRALEGVVKATVTDTDPKGKEIKVEKKGADLIQHITNAVANAQVVAGRAAEDAEQARGLVEEAKALIADQKQADGEIAEQNQRTVAALDEAVGKAETAAKNASGAAAEVKKAFDAVAEGVETLKIQVSMIAAVLLGKADRKDPNVQAVLESAMESEEGE